MQRMYTLVCALVLLSTGIFAQNTQIGKVSRERSGFNADLKPFFHGVASGDPTSSSVVIWTRVTPENNDPSISGKYFVATDTGFANTIREGAFTTTADKDYTVKIDLTGLNPGTTYYYYFQTSEGNSLIGRAKTCPAGPVDNLKFAVISCSNYEGGYFNTYGEIAKRNDIDAVIHLGDYIYEYGAGTYGIQLPGRVNEPATEILTLADYRTRYSLYRLDEKLIRAHQQHTFITIWDDHESANDSYVDGAENHQPNEGSWEDRKAVSKKVYFEWLPIRDYPGENIYRKVSYGNMADLLMLDTRLEGRVQPPPHFDTPDNPARNIISPTQYNWLIDNLKNSSATWKILGNQVLFSTFNVGFAAQFSAGNIDSIRQYEDVFIDNWESYPTQRNSIIDTLRDADIDNVVIITGDSHTSWAFDVTKQAVLYPNPPIPQPNPYNAATREGYTGATGDGSWAVEFGAPSVSSPNFDEAVGASLTGIFEASINNPIPFLGNANYNPHLKFVDLDRHGYFVLDLRGNAAQADFYYVPTVAADTSGESFGAGRLTLAGTNRLIAATAAAAPKPLQDIPAPQDPKRFNVSAKSPNGAVTVFSCYPNPTSGDVFMQAGFKSTATAAINVYDLNGKLVMNGLAAQSYKAGVYNLFVNISELPKGAYLIRLEGENAFSAQKVVLK
ncbi:MAG: alkaline phosphatase D family protein [Saprospiraceae bacterium]|nr:alkaline phosphatase D family protein [Saprospiraceae bacterium]